MALRGLKLRFGRKHGGNHNYICCATSCDYTPYPKAYGQYFLPKCRIKTDSNYENSVECKERINNINAVLDRKFNRKKHK